MLATYTLDGAVVEPGSDVVDFRGNTWTFIRGVRESLSSQTGKVEVEDHRGKMTFYATVFNLIVVNESKGV